MRRSIRRLLNNSSHMPRAAEWGLLALLGIAGLMLAFVAATVELLPTEQLILAVVTVVVFVVCNRRRGRQMTLFLTMLSSLVSLRYIVWRITETLRFNML